MRLTVYAKFQELDYTGKTETISKVGYMDVPSLDESKIIMSDLSGDLGHLPNLCTTRGVSDMISRVFKVRQYSDELRKIEEKTREIVTSWVGGRVRFVFVRRGEANVCKWELKKERTKNKEEIGKETT